MITSYDYFQNSTVYFDAYSGMITTAISMITTMETGECCHQIRDKIARKVNGQLTVWQQRVQAICTWSLCEFGSINSAQGQQCVKIEGTWNQPLQHI